MNANYGYQLYQAERTQTRAEILAGDARRGRWDAGVTTRAPVRGTQGPRSRDHGHHRGPDGSRRVIMTGPTRGGTA